MNCSRCARKAVIYLPYMSQHLCKEHFIKVYEKRLKLELTKRGINKKTKVNVKEDSFLENAIVKHYLKKYYYKMSNEENSILLDASNIECSLKDYLKAFITGQAYENKNVLSRFYARENELYAELEGITYKRKKNCVNTEMEGYIMQMLEDIEKNQPGAKFKLLSSFEKIRAANYSSS